MIKFYSKTAVPAGSGSWYPNLFAYHGVGDETNYNMNIWSMTAPVYTSLDRRSIYLRLVQT